MLYLDTDVVVTGDVGELATELAAAADTDKATGGTEHAALQAALRSGVTLCRLANRVSPGSVPTVSTSSAPFPQRENLKAFADAIRALGVPDAENFETDDLFEGRNMKQVLVALHSFGRHAAGIDGYDGPTLSVKGKGRSNSQDEAAASRSGKVRELSERLKIPTGAGNRIIEPGSVEWLELQRGASYSEDTPSMGGGQAKNAASALAAALMGGSPAAGAAGAAPSTGPQQQEASGGSPAGRDATSAAARQRARGGRKKAAPTRRRRK